MLGAEWFAEKVAEWGLEKTADYLLEQIDSGQLDAQSSPGDFDFHDDILKDMEYGVLAGCIDDHESRWKVAAGLELRHYQDEAQARLHDLRRDLRARFGPEGVRVAQMVQAGFLKHVWEEETAEYTEARARDEVVRVIENPDHHVLFITGEDDSSQAVRLAETRIMSHSPTYFGIGGRGDAADKAERIAGVVADSVLGYELAEVIEGGRGWFGVLVDTKGIYE